MEDWIGNTQHCKFNLGLKNLIRNYWPYICCIFLLIMRKISFHSVLVSNWTAISISPVLVITFTIFCLYPMSDVVILGQSQSHFFPAKSSFQAPDLNWILLMLSVLKEEVPGYCLNLRWILLLLSVLKKEVPGDCLAPYALNDLKFCI